MLNNHHRIAQAYQAFEHAQQALYIRKVQAGGGLVQNVDGTAGGSFTPFIITPEELEQKNLSPDSLSIICRVIRNQNEEIRQNSSTSEFIFNISKLISFISSVMTLEPGDIIATGTPFDVGELLIGDIVEVEIEGVGILRNTVSAVE